MGEMVQMAGDTANRGYLATPAGGAGAGVLVVHAWWGLNDFFKELCDRLAGEGFVVFAPDLYGGKVATTIDEASQLMESSDFNAMQATLDEGVRFLLRHPEVRPIGIGVVGFSMGAAWALQLAAARPGTVRAAVLFYGTYLVDFTRAQAAVMGHFCIEDEWEPSEGVEALESALRDAGRPVIIHRYENAGHWFFEADRPDAFVPEAAQLAWERTLAFLREQLGEEAEPLPQTDEEFIDMIDRGWAELQATWAGLTREQMVLPGPEGWAVKEHIAHVAFWEGYLLRSMIGGEPAEKVTGMDKETLASVDAINAIVARRAGEKSLDQVLSESRAVHDTLMTELRSRPLESWMQPRFADDPDERPLILWVAGNTWGHYAEHIAWIRKLLS